ncbi:hypothetical protein DEJ25_00525 [Curtobacterium sp. MCPF17_011]|uniref:cell division protein PerM n=1 Tax=unclassified Curtobacterium TaxID=257496 RepID=UPI000D832B3E|nr:MULTISPECIES: DUF6350 family protein [unclassified Curtobacterium]PYY34800.1 hypothetical protein DEI89_07860 [Curtobacterium sp. MCBD17_030]PZF15261.1 hypothetical protein DEJ25_00525 [Curtobacterium sp. MCPF17_011]
MNRLGTALLAVIEAIVTVGVGVGIALVPLTLLWAFEYGLQVDWDVFWTAAGNVWLIGHGVDVTFTLGAAAAKATGLSGASAPIGVSLAALGFAVVTAWLGARAGRRFAETEHRVTGILVGTAAVAVLGLLVALSSTSAATHPTTWQAVVAPALWFGIPAVVSAEVCRRRRGLAADPVTARIVDLVDRIPTLWRVVVGFGLRAGTVATACVVAVAAVLVGLVLLVSFAEVITLYERSHAGLVGGFALTVGQLAFIPDFVAWATAWLVGPGFAIGTGSAVSPIGTALGPVPAIPVLGALPTSGHTFGLVWILVPVVAGFAVGGLMRPRLVRMLGAADSALYRAIGGVVTGLVAGVVIGGLAWMSSGSVGPGRLADVGPHALAVGGFAALEVGIPALIALAIGSDLVRLPERSWIGERWHETEDDLATADATPEHGSLIAALESAGAGRTTEVHRFSVDEQHDAVTTAHAGTDRSPNAVDEDEDDRVAEAAPAATPAPTPTPVSTAAVATDVDLPDWARTDAVAAERVDDRAAAAPAVGSMRARLRAAASGARDRAGDLRDRASGLRDRADDLRHRAGGAGRPGERSSAEAPAGPAGRREAPPVPRTDEQPAFPWSTEEFVAGRDDVDPEPPARPAPRATTWDTTDQIPEDELPWWRKPKGDDDA